MIKPKLILEYKNESLLPWEGASEIEIQDSSIFEKNANKIKEDLGIILKEEAKQRDLVHLRKKVAKEKNKRIKRETKFQQDLEVSAKRTKLKSKRIEKSLSPWGITEKTSTESIKLKKNLSKSLRKDFLSESHKVLPKKRVRRIRKEPALIVSSTSKSDRIKYAEQIAASKKQISKY